MDCAAGSGRITELVLKDRFEAVDLFEMNPKFIEKAKERLRGTSARNFDVATLQDYEFKSNYDGIFAVFSLAYLDDNESVDFLKKCKAHLNEGGVIFMFDNFAPQKEGDYYTSLDLEIVIRSS